MPATIIRTAALAVLVTALAASAILNVDASTTHVHVRVRVRVHAEAGTSNATAEHLWTLPEPTNGGLAVGQWTKLESDNYAIADACKPQEWTVKQAKAAALQLHFASLDLGGHKLVVSAPDGSSAQEFSSESALHDVTTKVIPGSAAKISFQPSVLSAAGAAGASCNSDRPVPSFKLGKVFARLPDKKSAAAGGTKEASPPTGCSTMKNPTCVGGEMYKKAKSVLLLSREFPEYTSVCTAWLWGKTGLLLTNNHCVEDGRAAANATFAVQNDISCKAECSFETCTADMLFGGVKLLKTSYEFDYSLLQITDKQRAAELVQQFGYLRLQRTPAKVGDQIYIPQHPGGGAKKIAAPDGSGNANVASTDAKALMGGRKVYGLLALFAMSKHGSSGAPILSRSTNAVVGLLRGGSSCSAVATPATTLLDELEMYLSGIDGVQE